MCVAVRLVLCSESGHFRFVVKPCRQGPWARRLQAKPYEWLRPSGRESHGGASRNASLQRPEEAGAQKQAGVAREESCRW